MTEPIQVRVNGQRVSVPSGTVVAAAIARAGLTEFHRSPSGQPRGPLCGMGVCMECRVTIDGRAYVRSCTTLCAEGMEINTAAGAGNEAIPASLMPINDSVAEFDIVVVGAGPAGLAAACAAAESGRRVALVDETPWLGGQIWRGQPVAAKPGDRSVPARWFARFRESGARLLPRMSVVAAPEPGLLLAEQDGFPQRLRWQRLILATGARELFLPFAGWTLPGVLGPGGLQALMKQGWPLEGKRVVVAGSGPLLLAVAAGLRAQGARVVGVFEQAARGRVLGFGLRLSRHPAKLAQAARLRLELAGVPYHFGCWPIAAEGEGQVRQVTLTDGVKTWTLDCDYLACGFGLVPNVELPLALRCRLNDGFVQADEFQATSVPGVYCAGEPTGIGGADCALFEGQIAGYAAAGQPAQAEALFHTRAVWHRFRRELAQAFALRPELRSSTADSTLLCRCEDVSLSRVRRFGSWRDAKLQTRCGMGACQGRTCGAAAQVVLGWGMESVRPPVLPARVETLLSTEPQPVISDSAYPDLFPGCDQTAQPERGHSCPQRAPKAT